MGGSCGCTTWPSEGITYPPSPSSTYQYHLYLQVQTHCYEAVDIDNFVRLTNEFQFPVAAFHHAHEAWLVPDVLKRAYGKFANSLVRQPLRQSKTVEHTPAIAMFAAFAR
jgi:hypothetical protein